MWRYSILYYKGILWTTLYMQYRKVTQVLIRGEGHLTEIWPSFPDHGIQPFQNCVSGTDCQINWLDQCWSVSLRTPGRPAGLCFWYPGEVDAPECLLTGPEGLKDQAAVEGVTWTRGFRLLHSWLHLPFPVGWFHLGRMQRTNARVSFAS